MDPEQTPDSAADAAVPPTTPVAHAYPPPPPGYAPPAGYGTAPAGAPRQYPAPIGWVIAAVILFWPTAIPALLASHRSARAAGAGDVATADREAASAKRWGVISVCVGAAIIVLSLVVSVLWAIFVAVAVHDHRDGFGFHERGGSSQIQPFGRSDGGQQVGPNGRSGPGQMVPGAPGSGSNGPGKGNGNGFGRQGSGGAPTPAPTQS